MGFTTPWGEASSTSDARGAPNLHPIFRDLCRGLDDSIEFDQLAGTEEALDACDASIRFTAPTEQLQACRGGPMKDSLAGGNWRSFVWVCIGIDALAV